MIQQSPFMSLTTALFEAVADLNHQNIYPSKDTLHEYLRKHYPEIETPDTKTIHDCLGRLIKNRRLYHNGRGYFILFNENVLNEVIASKTNLRSEQTDTTSMEPSLIAFKMNDSRTSSSGHTDGHTDIDLKSGDGFKNRKRHDSSVCDTLTEVSTMADAGIGNISELNTPKLPRTLFSSRLFRNNKTKQEKLTTEQSKSPPKNVNGKTFLCSTQTNSIILSNDLIESPLHVSMNQTNGGNNEPTMIVNKDVLDSSVMSDDATDTPSIAVSTSRNKVKRSKSFNGKTRRVRSKSKEVSFALVGSPNQQDSDDDTSEEEGEKDATCFQRSHSFGVGYAKNKYKRPLVNIPSRSGTVSSSSPENTLLRVNGMDELNHPYDDLDTSFVDESLPVFDDYDPEFHLSHQPDMIPVVNTGTLEMLKNYKDLGSALSLPRVNEKISNFDMSDLLSPTTEECLAEELKQAYKVKQPVEPEQEGNITVVVEVEEEQIDKKLLSPRSRRRVGAPYESQYISDVLNQSEELCQALRDSKKDSNSNYLPGKNVIDRTANKSRSLKENSTKEASGKTVKLRPRAKSTTEERKKSQKERNSQLFEEKRPSLKVMGMV
jgi:Winged helix Storkhead-box1 domain.